MGYLIVCSYYLEGILRWLRTTPFLLDYSTWKAQNDLCTTINLNFPCSTLFQLMQSLVNLRLFTLLLPTFKGVLHW